MNTKHNSLFRILGTTAIIALFALPMGSALGQELSGKPRVIDGDTLEIAGVAIQLAGADAPPANAICGYPGQQWRCGQEATFALAFAMAEHWVTCVPQQRGHNGIIVARCTMGPYDLAERMIGEGWAMATGGYSFEEDIARRERRGIWRDGYVPPPGWRPLQ
jgi:endonuclease YncB( thermonuclease family)